MRQMTEVIAQGCIQRPTGAKEMLGVEPENCLQPATLIEASCKSRPLLPWLFLPASQLHLFGASPPAT